MIADHTRRFSRRATQLCVIGVAASNLAGRVQGATLTWDTVSGDGGTITPGSGNWALGAPALWNNGSTNVNWTQSNATTGSNAAIFAGGDGSAESRVVTDNAALAAQTLTFDNTGYLLQSTNASTLNLSNVNSVLDIAAGKSASIGGDLSLSLSAVSNTSTAITLNNDSTLNIRAGASLVKTVGSGIGQFQFTGPTGGGAATLNVNGTISYYASNSSAESALVIGLATGIVTANINSGGLLYVDSRGSANGSAGSLIVGNDVRASGVLNVNAGGKVWTPFVGGTCAIVLGGSGSGTLNLNAGGVVETGRILRRGAGATGTLNLNGGTIIATGGNSTNLITNLTRANVRDGGVIIEATALSNYLYIPLEQPLLHSNIAGDAAIDGGLTKTGDGVLSLRGASTYTGATIVREGRLELDGSIAGNAIVKAGGDLGGTGSVVGSITVETGGVLRPGDIFGTYLETLACKGLSMAAESTLDFSADSSTGTADLVIVDGAISLDQTRLYYSYAGLDSPYTWAVGDKLTLFSYKGAAIHEGLIEGSVLNSSDPFADDTTYFFGSEAWQFNYDDTAPGLNFVSQATGDYFVTLTKVEAPEPTSVGIVSAAVGFASLRGRRR